MDFLGWLFRRPRFSNAQYRQARSLVDQAHRAAPTSYRAMLRRFPDEVNGLREPYASHREFAVHWELFVTAVSVATAYSMMSDLAEGERKGMARAIEAAIEEWRPGSYDLMVEHLYHMRGAFAGEVGQMPVEYARLVAVWALLKLRGRGAARRVEAHGLPFTVALADALGSRILGEFAGWWRGAGKV